MRGFFNDIKFFQCSPKDMLLLILEREGRERNINVRGKHQSVASHMLPGWGSNLQPFGAQDHDLTN